MLAMHPLSMRPLAGGGGDLTIKIPANLAIDIYQAIQSKAALSIDIYQKIDEVPVELSVFFYQAIKSPAPKRLFNIYQSTIKNKQKYRFENNKPLGISGGFDFEFIIDGVDFDMCKLCDDFTIDRSENESASCSFTIKEQPSVNIDFNRLHSKRIEINVIHNGGKIRIYTGWIDKLRLNISERQSIIECSDDRLLRNNTMTKAELSRIGHYSKSIHGELKDKNSELEARLSTIPASYEYDANGNGNLVSWYAKQNPDFVIRQCDMLRRKPMIDTAARGRLINKMRVRIEAGLFLNRQRDVGMSFESGMSVCTYSTTGQPPRVESIRNAVAAAGWVIGNEKYKYLEDNGRYHCHYGSVMWRPNPKTQTEEYQKDKDGNYILDKNGDKIPDVRNVTVENNQFLFARSGTFSASKRWRQGVKDCFEILLYNSASISRYQEKEDKLQYFVEAKEEFESSEWGKYDVYQNPTGMKQTGKGDFYTEEGRDDEELSNTFFVAINTAHVKMLDSHRANTFTTDTRFFPSASLTQTHLIDSEFFKGKVKLTGITHKILLKEKWCETSLKYNFFQNANSDGVNLPVFVPPKPARKFENFSNKIPIYGVHKISWNEISEIDNIIEKKKLLGFVTKSRNPGNSMYIGHSFLVKTPDIDDKDTDARDFESYLNYDVKIHNDEIVARVM